MLPEQRGLLASWFSQFRSKRSGGDKRNSRKRGQYRSALGRNCNLETLEDRRLLTATIYIDFGDRMNNSVTMPENTVNGTGGWNTFGYVPVSPPGGGAGVNWVFGPQFTYAGNPNITYTPLKTVFADKQASEGFSFNLAQQPTDDPWQFQSGSQADISQLVLLENSIAQMIARMYAPFNVQIVQFNGGSGSTGFGGPGTNTTPPSTPAGFLAQNNPLYDPNTFDPMQMPPMPMRGPAFAAPMAPNTTVTGFQDVYILVGGWTLNGTQVGDAGQLGIFATASIEQTAGNVFIDPQYNSPGLMGQVLYSDGGAAILADEIIDHVVAGQNSPSLPQLNANVAIAATAAQAAAFTFGLQQGSDGEAKPWNKFFDAGIDLLSSSDAMREGPFVGQDFPTNVNMPNFTNFWMVESSIFNPLTQTVTENTGDFTLVQNAYQQLANNIDIGPSAYAYISGTGAFDKIIVTADAANPNLADVSILPFSDAGFDDSTFIPSFAFDAAHPNGYMTSMADPYRYTVDVSSGLMLIEAGNNADSISIDPTLFSRVLTANAALTGMQVFVFGGEGLQGSDVDTVTMTSDGTQTVSVTPSSTNPQAFNFATRFDTDVQIPTQVGINTRTTDIQFSEFSDTSTIHLENFSVLNYLAPTFLFATNEISLEHNGDMLIDGTAGPSPSGLLPAIGMANVEFRDIPTVNYSIPIGVTDDNLTVNTIDPVDPTTTGFAVGLVNFSVNLGPGNDSLTVVGPIDLPGTFTYNGGSGTDTITVDDATDWTLTDSGLTDAAGTTIQFVNHSVETANITGEGDPVFSVEDWSGDATLTGVAGGDTFNIGDTAAVSGNVTINASGFLGDTFNIKDFSGVGVFNGDSGNDVFNINTNTITMSSAATGTGTATAYIGPSVSVKTTTGSNIVKVVAGFGSFAMGQMVIGPNIPAGATILSVSGTNLTLSAVATGTGTNNTVIGTAATITQVTLVTTSGKKTANVVGNFRLTAGKAIVGNANIPANTNLSAISNITIDGGDGNDNFYIKSWNGAGDLHGGAGNDTFVMGTLLTGSPSGDGMIAAITQQHNISGEGGNDTIVLDDSGNASANIYTANDNSDNFVSDSSGVFGGISFDTTLETMSLIGGQAADTFKITPSTKTAFIVDGRAPTTNPGDELDVDLTGTKGPKLVPNGPNGGTLSFSSGHRSITYSNIEKTVPDLTQVAVAAAAAEQQNQLADLLAKLQGDPLLIASADAGTGSAPLVKIYDVKNGGSSLLFSFNAYEAGFKGGVRATLVTDVTGDGIPDLLVAPGSGRLGEVKLYSGYLLAAGASTVGSHLVANPDLALVSGANPFVVTTNGTNTVTMGIMGQPVSGPNIAFGTIVSSINNSTTIALSLAATGTGTVNVNIGSAVVSLKTTAGKTAATVVKIISAGGLIIGQSVAGSNSVTVTSTSGSKVLSVPTTLGLGLSIGEPVTGMFIPGNAIVTGISTTTITLSAAATGDGTFQANFDPVASNSTVTAMKLSTSGIAITLSGIVKSTGTTNTLLAAGFLPEASTYKSGLYIGAGDLRGDGSIELVTSRSSGVPNVEVFDVSNVLFGSYTPSATFNPYTSKFLTGAQVAVGDADGDGAADIVTVPGSGQSAQVEVFNFNAVESALNNNAPVIPSRSFLGFESKFKNGVSLTVGDFDGATFNGNPIDEIALGAGTGGTSRMHVFDEFGTSLVPEFKAFTGSNAPLRIAAVSDPTSGQAILFASQVNTAKSHVLEGFKLAAVPGAPFDSLNSLFVDASFSDAVVEADPSMTNGVFLG